MDYRISPLWLLLAIGCSIDSDGPASGVFDRRDDRAGALAEDLAEVWLADKGGSALSGVDAVDHRQVIFDPLGMAHVRLQQTQGGVPVFGAQAIVHLGSSGEVVSMTDGLIRAPRVDTVPTLSADQAISAAILSQRVSASDVEADLQILRHQGADHLTWRVRIQALETDAPSMPVVFVDAHTGEEIWRYDNLQTARSRRSHSANNGASLPGSLIRSEGSGSSGDAAVDDAHDFAGFTYDYYLSEHGRDSYDDAGAALVSTAHYGNRFDNAFWNGSQMVYGDGGTLFYPLSGSLEVVAHELTHAVTEHSAGLIYSGESGGLNEATSDILGVTIDAYSRGWVVDDSTWMVGEDITKPAIGDALRFMDDPPADGISIDDYADYDSSVDVHYSSGIANKAFYLMVEGPALDIRQAADIWYRALTVYMTPSTTFAQARDATVQAATDLFGAGSPEVAAVGDAWTGVGVMSYTPFDTRTDLGGSRSSQTRFEFVTPPGASSVQFSIAGGSGDADLYVKFGSAPTTTSFDCRPYRSGNAETCTMSPAQPGTYHVMLVGYNPYSGVTLTASQAGASSAPTCAGGSFEGTLFSTNPDDAFEEPAARSGTFAASLTGPLGTDFDLYLESWNGSEWEVIAQSIGSASLEAIDFEDGAVSLHRWVVDRWSGDGDYTLCVQ